MWTAAVGAIAGILTLWFADVNFSGIVVSWYFSGVIFAVIVTAAIAAQESRLKWGYSAIRRYGLASLALALGPPCGLVAFVAADRARDLIRTSTQASPATYMVLPTSAAIAVWALFLAIFLRIVQVRWRVIWFIQAIVFLMLIFAFVIGIDSATTALWQKSTFVPLFIIGEQVGSAIFLAVASGHHILPTASPIRQSEPTK